MLDANWTDYVTGWCRTRNIDEVNVDFGKNFMTDEMEVSARRRVGNRQLYKREIIPMGWLHDSHILPLDVLKRALKHIADDFDFMEQHEEQEMMDKVQAELDAPNRPEMWTQ